MKAPRHDKVPSTHKGMKKHIAAWVKKQRLSKRKGRT